MYISLTGCIEAKNECEWKFYLKYVPWKVSQLFGLKDQGGRVWGYTVSK